MRARRLEGMLWVAAAIFVAPRDGFAGDKRGVPCFGGEPQVALANQSGPNELVFTDGKLYWSGDGLQRLDLKTMKIVSVDDVFHRDINDIGPIDPRDVFARTGGDDIVALDLRTHRLRTLLPGHIALGGSVPRLADFPAADRNYLYFIQMQEGPRITSTGDGFFRIARNGDARPELLGAEPYVNSGVAIDGDFVYYLAASGGLANRTVVRRALQPDAKPQVLSVLPATSRRWRHAPRMIVAAGRVYYSWDWAIWSVDVNGGAAPTRQVELGPDGAVDMLVHGRCLYWATDQNVERIAVGGGAPDKPEIIADERHYRRASSAALFPRVLATDGRFLFWPDVARDRIMRAAPDAQQVAPAPVPLATAAGGGVALVDMPPPPGASWAPECRIHQACATRASDLPACETDGGVAEPWSQVEARALTLIGQPVRVEGPLVLTQWIGGRGSKSVPNNRRIGRTVRCASGECCRHDPRPLAIGGGQRELRLESFECTGDDSRMCCNAPAFGQRVIASGILRQREDRAAWMLSSPTVCVAPAR